MAITIPGTVTGAAQTGLTSPTYTTAVDTAVDSNSKQAVVTAIGGTQAGVDAHSISRPFTLTAVRPKQFNVLGKPNPTTGLIPVIPVNQYNVRTRKGVTPLAAQPSAVASIDSVIRVPAGSDLADPANLRAMISAHIGLLTAISAGLGDTLTNGVM